MLRNLVQGRERYVRAIRDRESCEERAGNGDFSNKIVYRYSASVGHWTRKFPQVSVCFFDLREGCPVDQILAYDVSGANRKK